jgi:Uma2 family endonuclease
MIVTPKRFSIEEYRRLADLGFFAYSDRLELIRGEIFQMSPKGTAHTSCCMRLIKKLAVLLGDIADLQCQDPITIPINSSEPEPDFAILLKRDDDYISSHPLPRDILLVIEISDSTLKYDRTVKLPLYAEAGIKDYWIFNLVENHLEAYSNPYQSTQGNFGYQSKQIVLFNQSVNLPGLDNLSLDLAKVFPPVLN